MLLRYKGKRRDRKYKNYFKGLAYNQVYGLENADYNSGPDYLAYMESFSFPVLMKFNMEPVRGKSTTKLLGRYIADRKSELKYSRSMGESNREKIRRQVYDLEAISQRVASGKSMLVRTAFSFRISAKHPVKLKESSISYKSGMQIMGFNVGRITHPSAKLINKEFSPFYNVASPYPMDTQSAATILPLLFTQHPKASGVAIGVDDLTEKPVFVDPFGKSSHNILVFGETGSGKSFFSKLFLIRMLVTGSCEEVLIVDPLDEYSCALFQDDCEEIYLDGISSTDSAFNGRVGILKSGSSLNAGVKSSHSSIIGGIYDKMVSTPQKNKIVLIDEAHLLLGERTSLESLSRLVRHSRHYNTSVVCITQNVDDLSRNQLSNVIAENSNSVFIFRTKGISKADLARFGLEGFGELHTDSLMGGKFSPYSECYLLEDSRLRKIRVISTEYENLLESGRAESSFQVEGPS